METTTIYRLIENLRDAEAASGIALGCGDPKHREAADKATRAARELEAALTAAGVDIYDEIAVEGE